MSSRAHLTFYRTVNVVYAVIGLFLGARHRDLGLLLSSVVVGVTDLLLLKHQTFDVRVLQPIRFLAATLLGPFWIYKGWQYQNLLLALFGLSFVLFDGGLFLKTDGLLRARNVEIV